MDMNKMDRMRIDDLQLRPDVYTARLKRHARIRKTLDAAMPDVEQAVANY
jgi:hypothetical protein